MAAKKKSLQHTYPTSIHSTHKRNMHWDAHNALEQGSLTFRLGFIIRAAIHTARTMFCTILEKKLGLCCVVMFWVSSHSTQTGQRWKSDRTWACTGNEVNRYTKYHRAQPKSNLLNPSTNRIGILELLFFYFTSSIHYLCCLITCPVGAGAYHSRHQARGERWGRNQD